MLSKDNFIGREEKVKELTEWALSEQGETITYIHDDIPERESRGGIGKTWLLRKIQAQLQDNPHIIPVMVDFFNVQDRDGVVIAERVVEAVKKRYPNWSTEQFNTALQLYHEAIKGRKEEVAMLRERLADALTNDLARLDMQMESDKAHLLLFFDTYETVEYSPVSAVLRPTQSFPDTYRSARVRSIIAGRHPLNWQHPNWIGRKKEVVERKLPPFNPTEAKEYISSRLNLFDDQLEPKIVETFHHKTHGRPILLGLVTDVLNRKVQTPEQMAQIEHKKFEAELVTYINLFEKPSYTIILAMAHVYHRFDADFLQHLLHWPGLKEIISATEYDELMQMLPMLSFVRSSDSRKEFVLHDEMRRLINKYCWRAIDEPDAPIRQELSRMASNYYNALIAKEGNQEQQQSYIVERLFHELFLNKDTGFLSFKEHFDVAIRQSLRSFARALFQELQRFQQLERKEGKWSEEQCLSLELDEARLLRTEENPKEALAILLALEQHSSWMEHHRSTLLFEKASCYLAMGEYIPALSAFNEVLQLAEATNDKKQQALLLNRLGYIHRLQGKYADAMRYYQEALKVQRLLDNPIEYANILNNIGNVLRMQGKVGEGLRYCKLALKNRLELFEQGRISPLSVGLSYSTLGHLYHTLGDLGEEEKAYRNAFRFYSQAGDKSSIAAGHIGFGRVAVRKREWKTAHDEFQEAERINAGADTQVEVEVLNQFGRLAMRAEKWNEAIPFFERAIQKSREKTLNFQLAENLLYLAEIRDRLNMSSNEQIIEASHIAREYDYTYLLSRLGMVQGDMDMRRGEYQSAFKHYRGACYHMTKRGEPEFSRTLNQLNDALLSIPNDFLPGVIDSLLTYWSELGLNEQYPEFSEICKEVSRHMLL